MRRKKQLKEYHNTYNLKFSNEHFENKRNEFLLERLMNDR